MRVLFVIDNLGSGGAQKQFVDIVNYQSNVFDVSIFLYNPVSNFFLKKLNSKIKIYSIKNRRKKGFSFKVLYELKLLMDMTDIVMSFLPTANIYISLASILSNKAKRICVENSISHENEGKIRRILSNFACYRAHHVICNSFTQGKYIKSIIGMKKKVSVIWNGYSNLNYKPRIQRRRSKSTIIIVGRIAYPKNGVRLLKAIKIFDERNKFIPNILWIGRLDDSTKLSKTMKKNMDLFLINNPRIAKKFHFIGEKKNIYKFYEKADALLLPSIYEGLPNVICEAMLKGCPVIASRISDNEKILSKNELRGFLCNPLSPHDICQALERFFKTSKRDIKIKTHKAHFYAIKKFSYQKMVSTYSKVIKSVRNV